MIKKEYQSAVAPGDYRGIKKGERIWFIKKGNDFEIVGISGK